MKLLYKIVLVFVFISSGFSQDNKRQLVIEDIEYEGAFKTRPCVFDRYLTIKPGDVLKPEMIWENRLILDQSDLFKEVDVYTRPGSEKGNVIVVIEVTERTRPQYRFEAGTNDLDGYYIVPVSFYFDNIFGHGQYFNLKWTEGTRVSSLSANYQRPELFGSNILLDVKSELRFNSYPHYIGRKDTTSSVFSSGTKIKIRGMKGFYKHTFVQYRIYHFSPKENDLLKPYFHKDFTKRRHGALSFGITFDHRDDVDYPTSGIWGATLYEIAHLNFGSQVNFNKFLFDFRSYKKLGETTVFAHRIKGGSVSSEAPYYERFYLGGGYSLRGYNEAELTPVGWGTKLFLNQFEFRFPLQPNKFPYHKHTATVWADIGSIWVGQNSIDVFDFYYTLGVGYRLKLPVLGIIRADLGYPVNNAGENSINFHLELGHSF